jgi:splicing factor 3A subunit 3
LAFSVSLEVQIREYHRRHPTARVVEEGEDPEDILKEEPWIEFSGEVPFPNYLPENIFICT